MKKILGLDIGIASISWALLKEPKNQNEQYSIVQICCCWLRGIRKEKNERIKKPTYAGLIISLRNNPYCDLLSIL